MGRGEDAKEYVIIIGKEGYMSNSENEKKNM